MAPVARPVPFMLALALVALALVALLVAFARAAEEPPKTPPTTPRPPNVVLIVADDLGYGDLGCFGGADIPTPHIDSIASAGVRFTQAYAYPSCSPTRAALMTGRYAERVGISGALMGNDAPRFADAVTVARMLRDRAGYATGIVGKWHLGYTDDVSPTRKGFDEFFGFRGGKVDYFKHTDTAQKNDTPNGKHDLWEGKRPIEREGYTTELFTARARQFIRDHADDSRAKPFFLYLAHNAPHYGKRGVWQAPDAYLERFGALGQTQGRDVYRAMVACLDDGVGEILAELEAQGIADDTLVIFISDNGASPPGSNAPLAGWKQGYQEGGVRVPWVARWPGVIPAGSVRDDVVHVIDLAPTLLAAGNAGGNAKPLAKKNFDGVNIWSAFVGGSRVPERTIYFSSHGLRKGKWKLLDGQLFDLENDPGETTNLAAQHPDVVKELAESSRAWAEAMGIEKTSAKSGPAQSGSGK